MLTDTDITAIVIEEAIRIHRRIGPGALERSYSAILEVVLKQRGLRVEREVPVTVEFDGIVVPLCYRLDLLVQGQVVVEVKSTEQHHPVHFKQVLTYLRHTKLRTGLLLNFGMPRLADGIHRVVNG
jgi:iron complex transport system substrate-binding protein